MVDPNTALFNQAYDALYHKVTSYVIAKCSNITDVQDIVQEIFIELYRVIQARGAEYIKNTEALAMRIAKTKLYHYYKTKKRRTKEIPLYARTNEGKEYERAELCDIDIEERYLNTHTVREVWRIISQKPADVQKVFALYYYLDLQIGEIAKTLNISESAVKRRLYDTLKEIRNIYKKEGE